MESTETLAIPMGQIRTPSFDDTTTIMTGVVDEVPVIGLHTPDKETWVIPLSVFHAMMEVMVEVYTPSEGESYQ